MYFNLVLSEQIRGGGGTGVAMRRRDGGGKGGTRPSHASSQPTTSSSNSKAQVARIKSIEDQLESVLRSTNTQYKSEQKTAGGVEGRLINIEKMMSRLTSVVEEQRKEREMESNRSQTSRQDSDGNKEASDVQASTAGISEPKERSNRKQRFTPISDTGMFCEDTFVQYHVFEFTEESKKCVNPYALIDEVKTVTGYPPKRVSGNNKRSVTVEVSTKEQSEKITSIKQVDNIPCVVKAHPRFNYVKALIYVHEFDLENVDEFKRGLEEKYNITDIQPAPFIKTKSPQTQVFIVTFLQQHLPYSIYIPGERQDTRVFKYENKPLMCNNCQQYGHPRKYCKSVEPVCKKCAVRGHDMTQCSSEDEKCIHCNEAHRAGSRECARYQREEAIVQIQEEEKVTAMRARQMLEKNNEFSERPARPYTTHFDCKMNETDKRKVTPWLLEKCLEQQLGAKPKTIRTTNKTTFTVEIASREQSTAMQAVSKINGIPVEISVNTALNGNKGLVYIYGYNMVDFEAFKAGLTAQYGLSSIIEATWIKPRNGNGAKPLLLTFPNELPQYLNIPGEMMMTKVIEYKRRPLMCKRCLEYGHGKNQCEKEHRCGKCATSGHVKEECSSNEVRCHHCKEDHEAGSVWCIEYRYQQEIISIQATERVSINQARAILDRRNPHFKKVSYADVIRNDMRNTIDISWTSNRPESKREKSKPFEPLRSEEEQKSKGNEVEVVCRSPNSGELFTTVVDLSDSSQRAANREDCTSETSAIVRAEVKAIYESEYGDEDAGAEEDRRTYESDVQRAVEKQRGENIEMECDKDRREKTRKDKREGKRRRSGTRRSRSKSNDRRRQSQSKLRKV